MYWLITGSWTILSTVVFWIILSFKWKRIDRLTFHAIQYSRKFHPIPGDPGYLDIKFSILRHSVFFLLSSVIIYYIKSDIVLTIILLVNLWYCWSSISRYKMRREIIKTKALDPDGKAAAEIISIPVTDSFAAVIHAIGCLVLIYILYAIRP